MQQEGMERVRHSKKQESGSPQSLTKKLVSIQEDMGKRQSNPHLPCLFEEVGGVRDPVPRVNHLRSGSLNLG